MAINAVTSVLIRGRQGEITDRRREDNMTTEIELGATWPQAKKC